MLRHAAYRIATTVAGEGTIFRIASTLKALERSPVALLELRQSDRLAEIIGYSAAEVPFYQGKLEHASRGVRRPHEALANLPILRKADLQLNYRYLQASTFRGRRVVKTTGGSTGEPVTILKNREATAAERGAMWYAYSWHGIRPGDRAIRFWGTAAASGRSRLADAIKDWLANRIRVSAFAFSDDDLGRYWNACVDYRPQYFHGYVSMIAEFSQFLRHRGIDGSTLPLKGIIATSEALSDPVRADIEDLFQTPVRGEYGSGEIGSIAFECEHARYHVITENVYVEILRSDGRPASAGEVGELVITDLNNRALPLLRYGIGDLGAWGKACPCGRSFPVIEKLIGRAYDFVIGSDGRRFHGEYFMYLFEDLRAKGCFVRQFQVVQHTPVALEIRFVPQGAPESVSREILQCAQRRLPGFHLSVTATDVIPRAPSGKMQVIRNLLPVEQIDKLRLATP